MPHSASVTLIAAFADIAGRLLPEELCRSLFFLEGIPPGQNFLLTAAYRLLIAKEELSPTSRISLTRQTLITEGRF